MQDRHWATDGAIEHALPGLIGVDFTSAPGKRKPITVARGQLVDGLLRLDALERCEGWPDFEALLQRPGPWLGAFDFPFGLPREAVVDLGWPCNWPDLVQYCKKIGRTEFRAALDRHREARPSGDRYAHRATDRPARSHSPLKLVNPPVGLMYLEGAPRLLDAAVTIPGIIQGDPERIAVEAYPGFVARAIDRRSYKSDTRARQSPAREAVRRHIVDALERGVHPLGLAVRIDPAAREMLIGDPRGDHLDALLALLQAGWCALRSERGFGLPANFDPIEGWIAGVQVPC